MLQLKFLFILTLCVYYTLAIRNCEYGKGYSVIHCYNVEIDYLRMIQDEPRRRGFPTLVSYVTLHSTRMEELTRDFIINNLPDVNHLEIHDSISPVVLSKGMFRKHEKLGLISLTIKYSYIDGVLEKDLWSDNDRLKEIILAGISIPLLKDQFHIPNLESLVLDNAGINEIEHMEAFTKVRKLKVLHLTNNYIDSLTSRTFSNLEDLRELSLAGNNIHCLLGSEFVKLKNLERLDLSSNPFKFVDLSKIVNPIPNIKLVKLHNLPCKSLKRILASVPHTYNDQNVQCQSTLIKNRICKFVNAKSGGKEYTLGELLVTRRPPQNWWESYYENIPCIDFMNLFDEYDGDMLGLEQIAGESLVQRSTVLSYRIENIEDRHLSKDLKEQVSDLRLGNFRLTRYTSTVKNQIPYYTYY